jgi:hypothetical protein
VTKIRIPYYVIAKGRGYWRPHPRMRRFGFSLVRCGKDGPEAWAIAESWNQKWQAFRKGQIPAPIEVSKLSRDDAEAARRIRRVQSMLRFKHISAHRNGRGVRHRHG